MSGNSKSDKVTIADLAGLMSELRIMAGKLLSGENQTHSVRPTALVVSALRRCRRSDQEWSDLTWENREHFFGSVYQEMQRALCDYARRRNAMKRPKLEYFEPADFDLYSLIRTAEEQPEIVIALDEALGWLQKQSVELLSVVRHHYFSGLKVTEISKMIGKSEATVKRRLAEARLMLHKKILELVNEI